MPLRKLPATFVKDSGISSERVGPRKTIGRDQVQDDQELFESEEMEDDASQHESSVRWINTTQEKRV